MSPTPPKADRRISSWAAALIVVGVFAALGAWLRLPGMVGEFDVVRIANGILYAHARGLGVDPPHSEFYAQSFGYYAALARILPASAYRDGTALLEALNLIGLVSGIVAFAAFATVAVRRFGPQGVLVTAAVALSPMAIPLAFSGHPLLPSAALFLLGAAIVEYAPGGRASRSFALELPAALLWSAALCVRADVILALPWLVALAWEGPADGRLARVIRRAGFVGLALALFVSLQTRVLVHGNGGDALRGFVRQYLGHDSLSRAGVVLLLAAGAVTWLAAGLGFARAAVSPALRARLVPALTLILPALVFWLPVPAPARHFFYAQLGIAELAVLALPWRGGRSAALVAVILVIGNFAVGEALYTPIEARYPWKYPSITVRRSTGSVTLGWFEPEHGAIAASLAALRKEGRLLAAYRDRDLLVFADEATLTYLGFIERGDVVRWTRDSLVAGVPVDRLVRGDQSIFVVRKTLLWPRDVEAGFLKRDPLPNAVIYTQPYTLSSYDRVRGLLHGRRLHLEDLPPVLPDKPLRP